MSTEQLRKALQDSAGDLVPPTDIVARARRGGRRRRYRRRTITAAVAAVAALAVAAGVTGYHVSRPDHVNATASSISGLLDQPARGNLADDRSAVAAARRAYAAETHGYTKGHVIWIGRTRYGDAAVVGHRVSERGNDPMISVSLLSRSGGGTFQPEDVSTHAPSDPGLAEPAFHNRMMIVLDTGTPTYSSTRHTFTDTGTRRIWHRVRCTDGAAALTVPRGDTMYVATSPHPTRDEIVGTPTQLWPPTARDNTLGWGAPPVPLGGEKAPTELPATAGAAQLGWARHGGAAATFRRAYQASRFADRLALWTAVPSLTPWVVYGQAPSGARFVLGEVQYDSEPSHLYAVVDGTVRYLGVADRSAVLPVRLKLPDGWVVAAKGRSLAYRTGTGGWHDAGRDAALVPAGTTEVRVGGTPVPLG